MPTTEPVLLFDFPDATGQGRPLKFADPVEVIVARTLDEVRPALRAVQRAVDAGYYAAGYLAYETAPAFDPALHVRPSAELPLLWFGIFASRAPHLSPKMPGSSFQHGSPTSVRQRIAATSPRFVRRSPMERRTRLTTRCGCGRRSPATISPSTGGCGRLSAPTTARTLILAASGCSPPRPSYSFTGAIRSSSPGR